MAAKLHDAGITRILNILFGSQAVDGTLYLGLYKNVAAMDDDADMTDVQEVSGFGYSRKAISRGSWTIAGGQATYAVQTFLASGGSWGDIYGYFITTSLVGVGGVLVASEHLSAPLSVESGKGVKISAKFTLS